ncbi:MAG: cytochrome c oxidase subunit [Solirubrobacteraceae bacterium]|jgi:cytochrome c oxidase subunit 2|nr:cytochrome c oxidase subunit [Solirubrobacteraceae bacterium]
MTEPNHWRRFATIWIVSSLIATPLVIVLLGPILPPGQGSSQASGHVVDNTVLLAMATPVLLMVVTYLLYAIVNFRQPRDGVLEGPAVRGDARLQTVWLVVTSLLVLSLATYGTIRLELDGAGSGGGPSPAVVPSGPKLPVQVIAQQWEFTYRYPTYGGVETPHLVLPEKQMVELHVTSLDVIHSFWAYQLGVKADANPNVDNVVFVKPKKAETFEVRCSELCGIWHGEMFDHGHVVSRAAFATWIAEQQKKYAAATKVLPPYSKTYLPEPTRRAE